MREPDEADQAGRESRLQQAGARRRAAESCRKISVQVAGLCIFGITAADSADSREFGNPAVPVRCGRVIRKNRCVVLGVAAGGVGILWQWVAGKLDWLVGTTNGGGTTNGWFGTAKGWF